MQTSDVATRLETLKPSDLRLSGAALFRRASTALGKGASLVDDAFKRVDSDRRTLLVRVRTGEQEYSDRPFLLFVHGGAVRALRLPSEGEGARFGPWRRSGERMVGTLDLTTGNSSAPCVVLLRHRKEGWRIVAQRIGRDQTAGLSFVGSGIDRVRISTRSYDLRRFSQPHAGPLAIVDTIWAVREGGISATGSKLRRTPLYDLDRFCDAVLRGDGRTARGLCVPDLFARSRRIVRNETSDGKTWATCPWSQERDESRFLGLLDLSREKGFDPPTFFEMGCRKGGWRIVRIRRLAEFPKPKAQLGKRSSQAQYLQPRQEPLTATEQVKTSVG